MKKIFNLSIVAIGALLLSGCGGDGSNTVLPVYTTNNSSNSNTTYELTPQSGTQSELFYGNSLHSGLGSLSNVRVFDPNNPTATVSSDDVIDVRYPVVNTSLTYNGNGSYSNLYTKSISYAAGSQPYVVSMAKGDGTEVKNSSATNFSTSSFSYQKIDYLGANQYLTLKDDANNTKLLSADMSATDAPLAFDHKTLEALTYQKFGGTVDGYIVIYDSDDDKSTTNELQKCNLDISTCTKIADVNSITKYSHGRPYSAYDMTLLGDISDSVESIYISESKIYKLDKANGVATQMGVVSAGSASHVLSGTDIFYLENDNIYKSTLAGVVTQISTDAKATGMKAFTDDMVMYGGDDYMYAVAKDGSLKDAAIEISVTTKTRGQKYPFDLGIGKQYLYTTYNVDVATGKTTYNACKLEAGKKECKTDAYWSAVTAAKSGTLNNSSSYKYTPYAYVRVDATDNYGGGKVKAIDPKHPLADGITMGTIPVYNFQTFVNSSFDNDMIDSEGNIVLYAKNDLDFRGDAFLMNLTKENSLVNLTNEAAPNIAALTEGRDHCHGRKCTVCHSFAGGKIYKDKAASGSANGYNVRFDFEDGSTSILAKIRKGSGENFNTPIENLVGKNFKAVVVDANGTDIVKSIGYYHEGIEFFNCNYCHGRNGDLKNDAPNVITIED